MKKLVNEINSSVLLDGDWCFEQGCDWHFDKQTKNMALNNICHVLNNFFKNPNFNNVIFCWPLHKQEDINLILDTIGKKYNFNYTNFTIICNKEQLFYRIRKRFETRKNELNINYTYRDIELVLNEALNKIDAYKYICSIKLDGNLELDELCNIVINQANLGDWINFRSINLNNK